MKTPKNSSLSYCRYACALFMLLATSAFGGEWDYPWDAILRGRLDQPIRDKLGKGWFMNLGPTGIRAKITHDQPCFFKVMFVFDDSPAAGKIKAEDVIIGANGTVMNVPHQFGRKDGGGFIGNEGPLTEMAKLLENAQAKDGIVELIVWPGGDKSKQKNVQVKIEAVGRFSPTYPFNCKRSDALMSRLCDFLAGEYKLEKTFTYRVHSEATCVLALMASEDPKHLPVAKEFMTRWMHTKYSSHGSKSWALGYVGVALGEYYLLTRDSSVIPSIESLNRALADGMSWASGSYSHVMYPDIMTRVHKEGSWGYGPMSNPGGLAMLSMSLFKEAGLPYSKTAHERFHQAFLCSVDKNGSIGYGFNPWECAILKLKDPQKPEAKSLNGIGYICPKGMKGMGEYEVVPPPGTSGARVGKDYDKNKTWLVSEADRVHVYDMGGDLRCAVRDMTRPEPTQPWPVTDNPNMHHGRMGLGALAHSVGASEPTWKFLADHLANACANSYDGLYDGHASGMMHAMWGSLGAAKSSPAKFRKYMDAIKWWFIMSEAHNGGFVLMPGRDYGPSDNAYANRNMITATAALILGLKNKRLRITGAASNAPSTSASNAKPLGSSQSQAKVAAKSQEPTRALAAKPSETPKPAEVAKPEVSLESLAIWHDRMIKMLSAVGKTGRKIKLNLGDKHEYLVRGATPQALIVNLQGNDLQMPWRMLSISVCAELAKKAVNEEDAETLLIAAVYQLAVGETDLAETLFAKASIKDAAAAKQARESLEKH